METFIEKLKELNMSKFDIDSLDQSIMQLKKQYNELMDNYSIQLDKILDDINNDINILKNYCFKKNDEYIKIIDIYKSIEDDEEYIYVKYIYVKYDECIYILDDTIESIIESFFPYIIHENVFNERFKETVNFITNINNTK